MAKMVLNLDKQELQDCAVHDCKCKSTSMPKVSPFFLVLACSFHFIIAVQTDTAHRHYGKSQAFAMSSYLTVSRLGGNNCNCK